MHQEPTRSLQAVRQPALHLRKTRSRKNALYAACIPVSVKSGQKLKSKLADGKARNIKDIIVTTFWGPDGKPMSAAQFVEYLYGQVPDLFKSEDELRQLWSLPDTRQKLLEQLEEKRFWL